MINVNGDSAYGFVHCPEEEGTETDGLGTGERGIARFVHCPEEEGTETLWLSLLLMKIEQASCIAPKKRGLKQNVGRATMDQQDASCIAPKKRGLKRDLRSTVVEAT